MAGARNGPKAIILSSITPYTPIYTYNCADGNAMSRGTLVEVRDGVVASMANAYTPSAYASGSSGAFIGVVVRDKEAGDGSTQVAVLTNFKIDVRASGAINFGEPVYCAGNDEVRALPVGAGAGLATSSGLIHAYIVGYAEETATDGEVIVVRSRC